jgi:hypothetical protein
VQGETLPPAAVEPAAPAAARPSAPVAPETPLPGRPAPRRSGGGSGGGGAALMFVGQLALSFLHGATVQRRVREQAAEQGYVPEDAPSGEGLLYDLCVWLIDPMRDAARSVGIEGRLNIPVWRARIRREAAAVPVGGTLRFTWTVGLCAYDFLGRQQTEERVVVYRKQPDGSWVVAEGNSADTIDFNRLLSPAVSDQDIRAEILTDPCRL